MAADEIRKPAGSTAENSRIIADITADSTDLVHSLVKEMFNSVSKLTEE